MPYVNKPRPYKKEYQQQLERGEAPTRAKRAKARAEYDKKGIDRRGKDINHVVPLSKGGSNSSGNLKLTTPSRNRSFSRNSDHTVKKNKPKRKRVKKLAEGGSTIVGDRETYGAREDGTKKGRGWLGEHLGPRNRLVTELSMGAEMNGKEVLMPTMVPGLTRGQVERLVSGKFNPKSRNPEDTAIKRRAIAHAEKQIRSGKSTFKD
jgi:hypothetical protein